MDFRTPDMDRFVKSSRSEFGKNMYENQVSLLNRLYKTVNGSMENVKTKSRVEVIERYMKWIETWMTDIKKQEEDILYMITGDSVRLMRDSLLGKGELVENEIKELNEMIKDKSKEYDY